MQAYPSGLRGRFRKPLGVQACGGSNPSACVQDRLFYLFLWRFIIITNIYSVGIILHGIIIAQTVLLVRNGGDQALYELRNEVDYGSCKCMFDYHKFSDN